MQVKCTTATYEAQSGPLHCEPNLAACRLGQMAFSAIHCCAAYRGTPAKDSHVKEDLTVIMRMLPAGVSAKQFDVVLRVMKQQQQARVQPVQSRLEQLDSVPSHQVSDHLLNTKSA